MHETEDPEDAARRELEEETGYTLATDERMRPLGSTITSMETVGALMAARSGLQ